MATSKFGIENYITVPGFAVVEHGLSGNELLCYSLIYGLSQDGESEFFGSLNYVASACNVTKQNAKKIIDRLIDKGLIIKHEIFVSGVKFCRYTAKRHGVAETVTGCYQNSNRGVAETVTPPVIETVPNNTNIDTTNLYNKDNKPASGLFGPEIDNLLDEITIVRPRGTSEPLCLFANSKYCDFHLFAAEFTAPEFADVDLVYYYHAVEDWSSRNGKKQKDWIATARNFMRNDKRDGKLVKKQTQGAGLSPDAIKYLQDMAD